MTGGWAESAEAWIASQGADGDFGRMRVLDAPMLARVTGRGFATALDVGCGEGRFCRKLSDLGIAAVGIDPVDRLVAEAKSRDPGGDYRLAQAEKLPFADASFDLVVSYLSLIDIPDFRAGIAEMARVLKPGGTLLIANLASYNTATVREGWRGWLGDRMGFPVNDYLVEKANWASWRGIRVHNWHRPLSAYMATFLGHGLSLTHFAEPAIADPQNDRELRYNNAPWFVLMEWTKPQLR